jgi:hypothetical protein
MNTLSRISRHSPVASAVQQLLHYLQFPIVMEELQTVLEAEPRNTSTFMKSDADNARGRQLTPEESYTQNLVERAQLGQRPI